MHHTAPFGYQCGKTDKLDGVSECLFSLQQYALSVKIGTIPERQAAWWQQYRAMLQKAVLEFSPTPLPLPFCQ
jgi:hypothetical protein